MGTELDPQSEELQYYCLLHAHCVLATVLTALHALCHLKYVCKGTGGNLHIVFGK